MEFGHPVSLILVDASFLAAVEALSGIIQARHPGSIIAVMYDDGPGQDRTVNDILGSKAVRGVLPMNLRLDIWLSVIRLMLRGGEYFPSSFFRKKSVPDTNDVSDTRSAGGEAEKTTGKGGRMLNYLTEREIQVLEMVSHGCQNKLIAAQFNLSEHTIKVHLHNIIKKLGARNRTAAAAIFLERVGSVNGSPDRGVLTLSGK